MKKTLIPVIAFTALSLLTAKADLLDGWDFATLTANTLNPPSPLAATVGSGSLDLSAFTVSETTNFAGSTINTFPGGSVTAGQALAIVGQTANNKSMIFSVSTLGYQDLIVTFAGRGTATGFNLGVWSWSTDGSTYNTVPGNNTATTSTTFALATADFTGITGMYNDSTLFLKYTLSGNSSVAGNNRLDNIQFNATALAVPEPGTLALAACGGVACLFAIRRRK